MARKNKVRILTDGREGFFARARENARKLDRGEALPAEVTITFENPGDMAQILSVERIRLLRAARQKGVTVSLLASNLKRDTRAVSRDIAKLETFGLLQTRYVSNPGHGRQRIVEASAEKFQLVALI